MSDAQLVRTVSARTDTNSELLLCKEYRLLNNPRFTVANPVLLFIH